MQYAKKKLSLIVTDDMYIKPSVTKDTESLQNKYKEISEKTGRTICINMSGTEEQIKSGFFYDSDKIINDDKYEIINKNIDDYINYLDEKYTTFNNKRVFVSHKGEQISVGAEGDKVPDSYGFILNKDQTKAELEKAIKDQKITEMNAVWDRTGNGFYDVNEDIGNTYIEISIAEQHLWFYKDGKLIVDSDVVTGLDTELKHTPKGIYTMFWKDTNTRLKGSMAGESWDVRVDYWLSVTNTGIGIHTAPWQPSFGGDAYKYRGSHGCINVPYETGKALYENVDLNTVVVIY